jgi:hypothetical protein
MGAVEPNRSQKNVGRTPHRHRGVAATCAAPPLDVLKAYEGGIENAIAALGTINTTFLQVLSLWMEERSVASLEPM